MKRNPYDTTKKSISIRNFFYTFSIAISFICTVFLIIDINLNFKTFTKRSLILFCIILVCALHIFLHGRRLASTDSLTGLINQKEFFRQAIIKQVTNQLKNYTGVFVNLKGYKYVNRLVGSANGDRVLTLYAEKIKRFVKKTELAGRLGGDNFVFLIQSKRLGAFLNFIENVQIQITVNEITHTIPISAYMGIYELTEKDHFRDILGKTSIALSYVKAHKTNDYMFYNEQIEREIYRENKIAYLFSGALENEEFKVYYQPKIDLTTRSLVGCEALVRWEHSGVMTNPSEFIPVLEKTGLITQLDYYVMKKVCMDINSWKAKGLDCVPVAVNFSKHHLSDAAFSEKILNILNINNTDRSLFELELTESENFEDYDSLLRFLEIMKNNGIKTAIDDFGIGYSSLSLLKNTNVKIVKIDKSFIDNITQFGGNNQHAILTRNIVRTCRDLNKEIICEGVETKEQLDILQKMDCTIIQGFYFDRPLTYKGFEERLKNPFYD